jgi:hypothetical protein
MQANMIWRECLYALGSAGRVNSRAWLEGNANAVLIVNPAKLENGHLTMPGLVTFRKISPTDTFRYLPFLWVKSGGKFPPYQLRIRPPPAMVFKLEYVSLAVQRFKPSGLL